MTRAVLVRSRVAAGASGRLATRLGGAPGERVRSPSTVRDARSTGPARRVAPDATVAAPAGMGMGPAAEWPASKLMVPAPEKKFWPVTSPKKVAVEPVETRNSEPAALVTGR